jgi:hypothetical protein
MADHGGKNGLEGLGNLPAKIGEAAAGWAAYWLALPKQDGVPLKRALDPIEMRRFVANLVMVERHGPRQYTWRLMGTAVRNMTGVELTRTEAFEFHTPQQREKALVAYNAQLDTPCGVWGVTMLRGAGGFEIPVEVLVLPLRADDGTPRFLANTVARLPDGRRPNPNPAVDVKLLSWPDHRFLDIGFGLPKLASRRAQRT